MGLSEHARTGLTPRVPRERFGPAELLRWLEDTQDSNELARRSHAKRRAALRASPGIPP